MRYSRITKIAAFTFLTSKERFAPRASNLNFHVSPPKKEPLRYFPGARDLLIYEVLFMD
jgi:hypothetical protein